MGFFEVDDIFLSQNFQLDGVPLLFGLFVKGVKLEHVQILLCGKFFLKIQVVCDLILNLNQIQLWNYAWMLLETCLSDGEQVLNRVLCLLTDFCFMQKGFEPFEYGIGTGWGKF